MLNKLGLEFEGRKHSGIDDARNIARIALELSKRVSITLNVLLLNTLLNNTLSGMQNGI